MLMMIGYGPPMGMTGFAVDLLLWIAAIGALQPRFDAEIEVVDSVGPSSYRHPHWVKAGWVFGVALIAYAAATLLLRPMFVQWGTTADERVTALPGDEVHPMNATYRIDHAITIHAPASAVWPWLAQLGQGRGGFYSYDWLEGAFGDDIQNADRIHPEWQSVSRGDLIRATQSSYLGGKFGDLGWKVLDVIPGRALILENWGAFVVEPVDSSTTRLIVRTRGAGNPSFAGLVFGPLNVFVFEPAHFIMQRGMLRGIRDRAEELTLSS